MDIVGLIREELKNSWIPISIFSGVLFIVVFIVAVGGGDSDFVVPKLPDKIVINRDEIVEVDGGYSPLNAEATKYKKVKKYFIRQAGRNRYFLKKKQYDLLLVDYFNPPLIKQDVVWSAVKKLTNSGVQVKKKKTKTEKETDYLFQSDKK